MSNFERVTLDDIFKITGEFGPRQRLIYFLYSLSYVVTSMQLMSWVFVGADLPHRCRLPHEQGLTNVTFNGDLSDSTCEMEIENGIRSDCKYGFVYNTSLIGDSIVKEWNLVCNRDGWRALMAAAPMAGYVLGGVIIGHFSDHYGRKPAFLISICILFIAGVFSAISWEVYSFTLSRFLVGFAIEGVENCAYVMGLEIVGPSKRALAGVFCWLFESLGLFCTVGIAYLLQDNWRTLQSVYAITCIFFVTYYWFTPESMRWLLSKNRIAEASKIVNQIAKSSGKVIPDDLFHRMEATSEAEYHQSTENESLSILILLKFTQLRNKSLIVGYIWAICAALYYVLLLDQSELSNNPYLGFFITSSVQIPSIFVTLVLLEHPVFGRKRTLSASLILSGLCECLIPVIPSSHFLTRASISTIGRFFAMCSYMVLYLFSTEQFPTVVRGIGLGFCAIASRAGSVAAPFILLLGHYAPLVFGTFALLAGLVTLLLPETTDRDLPETIEDGEMIPLKLRL